MWNQLIHLAPLLLAGELSISARPVLQVEKAAEFKGVAATNFIQWSQDEGLLLTASPSGDLLIFGSDDGTLVKRIKGDDSYSAFAVFLPGDDLIAASDYAGRLTIFDRATGRRVARERGHDAEVAGTAVSADGSLIATSDKDGGGVIWGWDGVELTLRHRIERAVHDFANQVTFSPDGSQVAVCGSNSREDGTGEVTVFDTQTGERCMRAVTPTFANSVEFSSDGSILFVGTSKGKIRGLDVASGGPAGRPGGVGPLGIANARSIANDIALVQGSGSGAVGPTGVLAACGDGALRCVSFMGKTLWTAEGDARTCYYVSRSPSGKRIATSGTEGLLRIFAADGSLLRTIGG